jgi:hypothetical protein
MSNWLYPISKRSGYRFRDSRSGSTVPVSFESFRDRVVSGKIQDRIWHLATGYRAMKEKDRVWVYMGEQDVGVIGVATATAIHPPSSRRAAVVHLRWDVRKTRQLVAHPVPAPLIRKYISHPRRPALAMDHHPKLLKLLRVQPERRALLDRLALKPLRLKPVRELLIRHKSRYRALLAHDSLLGPVERILEQSGYAVGLPNGSAQVDLAARKGNQLVIVEAKTLSNQTDRLGCRAAFAQLHEYRWLLAQRLGRSARFSLWAMFSREPSPTLVRYLEDSDVIVSWRSARAPIRFSSPSRKKVLKLLEQYEL